MSGVRPLTDLMVRTEINALRRLHGMLEHDGIKSREQFRDMMSAAFAHGGLELRALSNDIGFSFSAVFRWQEGQSAPHPSLWPKVVSWVLDALSARIVSREAELPDEVEHRSS